MISLFVLISIPFVTAAFAAMVRPVHVTVIFPAVRVAVVSKLIVTTPEANADVAFVTGEVMLHLSAAFAVTRSLGNEISIWLPVPAAKVVEVVNEIDAVPVVPTAVLKDPEAAVMIPTAGTLT